jgi:hypothetical protein
MQPPHHEATKEKVMTRQCTRTGFRDKEAFPHNKSGLGGHQIYESRVIERPPFSGA